MRGTLSPPLLAASSEAVAGTLGLYFPEQRWADLERGLTAAARDLGSPSVERLARRLVASPDPAELEVVAEHLTVGETWFFRERDTLEAFLTTAVPDIARRSRETGRPPVLWCAGCCTGEEAYTIAMLVSGLLPAGTRVVATDLNPQFVRKARTGKYREWSFRGVDSAERARWFRASGDGRWEVAPAIRRMITFSAANLVDGSAPLLANAVAEVDAIFCRNVLMYFSPPAVERAVRTFHGVLVPGGWLAVGATEVWNAAFAPSFAAVALERSTLYRKAAAAQPQVRTAPAVWSPEPEAGAPLDSGRGDIEEPQPARAESDPFEKARRCANEGRHAESAVWCEQAIAQGRIDAQPHFLLATVLHELGEDERAMQSLRRALYLEPAFVMARIALADLERRAGRTRAARREWLTALGGLRNLAPDEVLPGSDGMTAGRLAAMLEALLDATADGGTES